MRSVLAVFLVVGIAASTSATLAQSPPGTGLYLGTTAGYGSGGSQQHDTALPPPAPPEEPGDGSYHVRGASVGLSGGFGLMLDKLLLGVEADVSRSGIDGQSSACGGTRVCGTRLEDYATLRARTGLFIEGTLAYLTGGLAVGKVRAFDRLDPALETTRTQSGWTVGAGLEQRLAGAWSARLEYLYMDFGTATHFTILNHTAEQVELDVHTVRLGLSYALGFN